MPDGSAHTAPRQLGLLGRNTVRVLRWLRRRKGWAVETREAFNVAVATTAMSVEANPLLPTIFKQGRNVRIAMLSTKMIEVLTARCGDEVAVWQLVVDDAGAMGEASLGSWIQPFRITVRVRR